MSITHTEATTTALAAHQAATAAYRAAETAYQTIRAAEARATSEPAAEALHSVRQEIARQVSDLSTAQDLAFQGYDEALRTANPDAPEDEIVDALDAGYADTDDVEE